MSRQSCLDVCECVVLYLCPSVAIGYMFGLHAESGSRPNRARMPNRLGLPVSFGRLYIGFRFIHDRDVEVWGVLEVPTHLPRSWGAFNEVLGRIWRARKVQ